MSSKRVDFARVGLTYNLRISREPPDDKPVLDPSSDSPCLVKPMRAHKDAADILEIYVTLDADKLLRDNLLKSHPPINATF